MRHLLQRTIQQSITCTGIGLHSGEKIKLSLHPAPEGSGITFHRTDLPGAPAIRASLENVTHTRLATTLGRGSVSVATVEHLMAALTGLGIDNLRVDVSGPELPIMDGSAAPFVYLIRSAGVRPQSRFKKFLVVTQPIRVEEGDKFTSVEPASELVIDYSIHFDHPLIHRQAMTFRFSDLAFDREISRARTFGFLHEVEYLKKNGFALGGSLANAVVVDRFRILNQDGLRFPDEFVRHKVLDFLGDISLVGTPIIGRFTAEKAGHALNHLLMKELMAHPEAWKMVEYAHPALYREQNIRVPQWGLLDGGAPRAAAQAAA